MDASGSIKRHGFAQRSGKWPNGFVFLSLEDETGVMNAIVTPAIFDRYNQEVIAEPFLLIDGPLQNLDGVVSVKAARIAPPVRAGFSQRRIAT